MHSLSKKIFRTDQFPTVWCPGCGDGVIAHLTGMAIDQLGIFDDLCTVGGIGCSGWIGSIINTDWFKGIHGRALPPAIALKLTNPTKKVIVFTGDGDCAAIGGNHFLHACHKNVAITVVMVNNQIYGMTGGQVAPTTPQGANTATSPYGKVEPALDLCKVAEAAGASFVSRWTTAHPKQLLRTLKKAIMHPGLSYVEVMTQCPVQTGRYVHGTGDPVYLVNWLRKNCISRTQMDKLSPDERVGKVLIGDFVEEIRPEFCAATYEFMAEVQAAAAQKNQ